MDHQEANPHKTLALFDFDGTITRKDTLLVFVRYTHGSQKMIKGLFFLSPILILYKFGLLSSIYAKESLLSNFYKGWTTTYFNTMAKNFANGYLPNITKKSATDRIEWHHQQGHRVIVVSASIENYLKHWCRRWGVECIGTILAEREGYVTGKINGRNCRRQEKVTRIKNHLNPEAYEEIYVYGDSNGDEQMLKLATQPKYNVFY
jgi:HAD superfamily hydrolase (TIGR01490 family)